ncbi:MAG: exonuclease SbcCD subunit D [Clostridia bacterium]|nr:exonuclease SbcCD subunit D [Clostridia bacterium]
MKLLHLADLHFGKTLHSVDLAKEDQPYWADETIKVIAREKPNAVIIAGDIYDRGVPSKEAVKLCSSFLTRIVRDLGIPVLLTAGNHDGGERLEFANDLLTQSNLHIAGTISPEMVHWQDKDEYGEVNFWLMPFVFPAAVREAMHLDEDEVTSYTEAVRALIAAQPIDYSKRNVLIAHQMVLHGSDKPLRSQSETAVGGVGGVESDVFAGFDYVALGHIHGAQKIGGERIRYAGAPLCYHFSEANQKKGLLFVELSAKDAEPTFETVEVKPLHPVHPTITDTLQNIIDGETANPTYGAYIRVELTDDTIPMNARETLAALFESHGSRLLELSRAERERHYTAKQVEGQAELSYDEYFDLFYREQRDGESLSDADMALVKLLTQQILDDRDVEDHTEDELVAQLVNLALKQEAQR